MSKNSIFKTTPAGYTDSDLDAIATIPDIDPGHFTAPNTWGTWANFAAGLTLDEVNAGAGRLVFKLGGTLYYFPCFSAPLT